MFGFQGHFEQAHWSATLADLDQAINLSPKDAEAYHNRGSDYAKKGDYDRAVADYTEAIRLNPKFASAYGNRGAAYAFSGQRDKAIADFRKAIELRPGDRLGTFGLKHLSVTP